MSDIDPADLTLPGRRPVPDPFDDDEEPVAAPNGGGRRPEREGLPPSYRMRADAHYVDQLTAPRRPEPARAALADGDPPDADPFDRDRLRARMHARLAEDLATIASAAALLAGDASPMARRLNTDLIRAEALIRIDCEPPLPCGLLALGQRAELSLDARHDSELLLFLGRSLAAMIRRCLVDPTSN